jgi:hypothetical protein
VKSTPNVKKPHNSTTKQLGEAYGAITEFVPMNSAMKRSTQKTIKEIYGKYVLLPNLKHKPVNEEYFRQLVHELKVKIECDPQRCLYHSLWRTNGDGLRLGKELYNKCATHFKIYHCQSQAYYNFKIELASGKFGHKMFDVSHAGHLLIADFVQLDPSSSRHKDCIVHIYGPPADSTPDTVTSIAVHYIGDDNSIQPNNTSFAKNALLDACRVVDISKDSLIVIFSDNGPKEFNSDMIGWLPKFEEELNRGSAVRKKVVYNFFCENHGGSSCDGDGNNARRVLSDHQRNKDVQLETTGEIVDVVNNMKNTVAKDATCFMSLPEIPAHNLDFTGIRFS